MKTKTMYGLFILLATAQLAMGQQAKEFRSQEGDRLMIDMPRGSRSELFPESETKFFLKVTEARLVFDKDEKHQVTHLEIQVNGQQLRAPKIK